jgi:L-fuconate dehydratase
MSHRIVQIETRDARFELEPGAGTDAIHRNPQYAYATTLLHTGDPAIIGTGFVLTLGAGNDLVNQAIEMLAKPLLGREIEDVMAGLGALQRDLANHPQLRWLGPHKGVVHLALASITNACFDLWAMSRGVPLWSLLLDLDPGQLVDLLDLSALEDTLDRDQAVTILRDLQPTRSERAAVLTEGYPGYDTSIGWFGYSDERLVDNAREAVSNGFHALKLKVGSTDPGRDIRRATLLREAVGPDVSLMIDVNQQWSVPQAIDLCHCLAGIAPFWIEEPTHPDDILGHQRIARAIAPLRIATGEHVANRIAFKNYINAGAVHYVQADCTRVAGISEFLTVALLAKQAGLPVAPHVGDMGQIHQHLMLFLAVALDNDPIFLEHIPHLRQYFVHPARIRDGRYVPPQEPGSSTRLIE